MSLSQEDAGELEYKLKESKEGIEVDRNDLEIHNRDPRFKCRELSVAITKLDEAIMWVEKARIEAEAASWPEDKKSP